jgi:eukaryotic-like serine/threonine-protein kinase
MRVGDSIGPYTLERELGSGGMALVWLALNTELNRYEALKHPRLELLGNEDTQGRFEDEARLSASLIQPNIVTIHAVGSQPHPLGMNVPYCTMELLLGGSLTALIRERKQFSIAETVAILSQAAVALDYAHARNIIHRDVKPGNMMFTEAGDARTVLKVTDFGLAKALDAGDGRTSTGHILGTPRYISPEQAGSGAPVGPGTDQYALAVLAYEMITHTRRIGYRGSLTAYQYAAARPPRDRSRSAGRGGGNALTRLGERPGRTFPDVR